MSLTDLLGEKAVENMAKYGGSFVPSMRYYPAMDELIYLWQDCAYRASNVGDGFIELLLAPNSDDVVGVKIPCASKIVDSHILEALKKDLRYMVVRVNDNGTVHLIADDLPEGLAKCAVEKHSGHKGHCEMYPYSSEEERLELIKMHQVLV